VIDLRSDTVTVPTAAMRSAMGTAEVGDDVYGDDPTVNGLERDCAALFGKQAALFVPTGSMGNLTSIAALAGRGEEVLCEENAHVLNYEGGGLALFGLVTRSLAGTSGLLGAADVSRAARPGDDHSPRSAVAVAEITHTTNGGTVPPLRAVRELADACHANGTALHLDGARLFNAQVATGIGVAEWSRHADTVTFCFSKGLGAPAGAMVLGDADVVHRARLIRKRLGGSMRQAGVLAAAARVGLEHGVAPLAEDHRRAQQLAQAIAGLIDGSVDPAAVHTNIVQFDPSTTGLSADDFARRLRARAVATKRYGPHLIRLVTHRDLTDDDIATAIRVIRQIVESAPGAPGQPVATSRPSAHHCEYEPG
jgi:threonine aldolase